MNLQSAGSLSPGYRDLCKSGSASSCSSTVDRKPRQEGLDLAAHGSLDEAVRVSALLRQHVEDLCNQCADLAKFRDPEAAGGAGRRAQPDAGSYGGLFRVERNAVLVAGDVRTAERRLGGLAGEPLGPQIDQHEMRIGAAGDNVATALLEGFRQRLGVFDNMAGVFPKRRAQRLAEGDRLGGNHMHQRAALQARE